MFCKNALRRICHQLNLLSVVVVALLVAHVSVADEPRDPTGPHPKVAASLTKIQSVIAAGPFNAEWSSLEDYNIPQWYF